MKKKIIAIIVVIAVILLMARLTYLTKNKGKYVKVKTTTVSQGDIEVYLSTTASIKSQNVKEYYGPQSKVTKINVKVGDSVKSGDILATYETQDLNTQVSQAQIQYDNAVLQKKELNNQNSETNSSINDFNSKISNIDSQIQSINNQISQLNKTNTPTASAQVDALSKQKDSLATQKSTYMQQRDSLKPVSDEKFQEADNAIKTAQLNLNTAKQNLAKNVSSITCDTSGVVTAVNITEGSSGTMQQPAIVVQDVDNLKASISISRYDAAKVKLNQSAIISNAGKKYNGMVTFIAPAAEASKTGNADDATLDVDITITDKSPDLKIGFSADADILLNEAKNVVKVPVECVKTDKTGKSVVYIVKDNKAVEKEVQVGVKSETEAQVQGIDAGEKVILNPTNLIKNGTFVR